MRILQAMAGSHHGGAEAFFERLAIALSETELEQKVVIRKNARRSARLRIGGVETTELSFGGMLDFYTPFLLKRIVHEFNPQIILTWMNRASQFMPRGRYVSVARLGGYYNLKYYNKCDYLIGNTKDIVDYIVNEGWPRDRVHYLPNFVSSETALPIDRSDHSTPAGVPLLLTLGRLHVNKAFDVLLRAMTHAPRAYLWIAGDGPEELILRRQVRELGLKNRVKFLGWRQDIAALMATCDIYVCSSRHEPLGNVILESWAASKPVIATASQGPKALIEDEKTGLLAEVDNADELGVQINRLINDISLAIKFGEAGNAEFKAKFTKSVVVPQYKDFFRLIAGGQ